MHDSQILYLKYLSAKNPTEGSNLQKEKQMEKEIALWDEHLSKITVKDLIPSGFKLVFVKSDDKVFDVLNLLSSKRMLSVPIFDTEKKQFVGLVDVLDLLCLFVTMSDMKRIVDLMNGKEVDWASFISKENKILQNKTIHDVSNASARNPWSPINANRPISELLEKFSGDVKLHRVPVIDDAGEVISIITQSRVIEFLAHEVPKFSKIAERKLKEWLPNTERQPISVSPSSLALDAYRVMLDKGISAVAVVDDKDGKFVGCLSASDIKGSLDVNLFADLYLPIPLYLDKATEEFQRKSLTPITCSADDTMIECLRKISSGKVHRLFMVNAEGKATTVLSLGDFIAALHCAVQDTKSEKTCI